MKFEDCIAEYIKFRHGQGRDARSLKYQKYCLQQFYKHIGRDDPRETGPEDIRRYFSHLKTGYRTPKGGQLGNAGLYRHGAAVYQFFEWLEQCGRILASPVMERPAPPGPRRLPKALTEAEAARVLESCPINTPAGLRDRAILELIYSTGIRAQELTGLNVEDYLAGRGELVIAQGKGRKDRVVPVGEYACVFIEAYLKLARPWTAASLQERALFVNTRSGGRISRAALAWIIEKAARKSGIGKKVTPHMFRHSMATHLLRNKADLRHVQAILGHASIRTTEIYTQVTVDDLREAIRKSHPHGRKNR
ncbi:MAG: tyrosine-type recombinase/integrase [Firmicutes bacterium]|nr:tyrosine-type recombinase/integrase [Bacillota bacterium]